MSKATKAELYARRKEIQELLVEGLNHDKIIEITTKKYKTSRRAIQEDLRKIADEWKEKSPEESAMLKNKYMERLERMFSEAFGKGHIKVALEVQKEINKLSGVMVEDKEKDTEIPKFINIYKKDPLKVVGENES